jgi:Ser/Thr protein kinase RdoA (MazF antagonist)
VYDLLNYYQQLFKLQNANFFKIEHEDAIVATVYKVSLLDGKQYILKICSRPNDYLCEIYFLKYFENKIPVARIIDSVEPRLDIPGAILMECLQGNLVNKFELSGVVIYEIGSLLAKIHTNNNQLSANSTSYFTYKFEEGIAECSGHLSEQMLSKSRAHFNANINLLDHIDGPCIVHRDFRPGNILIFKEKIQGIIDWSSARGSFAEEDFCSLELGDWSDDAHIKKAFLKGYANIRPVPNYIDVMSLLLLSKTIATIGFTIKTKTWDNKNRDLYNRHLQLLENVLER